VKGESGNQAVDGTMEAILNTEEYKQRLQVEEQRLLKNIHGADARARDLSDEPGGDWSDASVRDEEKTGSSTKRISI